MKIKRLNNKELRLLSQKTSNWNLKFEKGDEVYSANVDDKKVLVMDKQVIFFYYNNKLIPGLRLLLANPQINSLMKKVVVDMGAVKFVVNGADIMRPGIVELDSFLVNDILLIIDVDKKRPLAVGLALFNSDEMREKTKGKVIKNIHFIGDKLWDFRLS